MAAAQESCNKDLVEFEGKSGRIVVVDGAQTYEVDSPQFKQCDTELIAERGTQETDERFRFEGNVRIVERGDTVYADRVIYDTRTKIGEAFGNVLIAGSGVILSAPEAIFYTDEKRTVFNAGVVYEDSSTVLQSQLGTYWSESSNARFSSIVRLWQSSLYVEADSVSYSGDDEVTLAWGHVYIERTEITSPDTFPPDTTRAGLADMDIVSIFGDTVYHNALRDSSLVTGSVFMLQTKRDSSNVVDSLFVRAELLTILFSQSSDLFTAVGGVEVIQGLISVVGDSLVHSRRDLSGVDVVMTKMFGSPMAWLKQTQISSDSLYLTGIDGSVDSLLANGNVFVAENDTSLNRIQQLKGRALVGLFEQDTLRTMTVAPNAEALYYVEAEEKDEQAAILSSADRIVFKFSEGSVADVRSYDGIEGTFFPSSIIDRAQNLDGFLWAPDRRPVRSEFRLQWSERLKMHKLRDR